MVERANDERARAAVAWVESPLQLLAAAEWAHRHRTRTGGTTSVMLRITDPHVVSAAEELRRMGAPFVRFEPYVGIPWARLAGSRHWVVGDPMSGQFRAALSVLPSPRRVSLVDDGSMIVRAMAAIAGETHYSRPGHAESRMKTVLGEFAGARLRRLAHERRLELFTAFPAALPTAERLGATIAIDEFAWLRDAAARGLAPEIDLPGERLVLGTARVVDGQLSAEDHLRWVARLARDEPVGYLPHRREAPEQLAAVAALPGVTVVRTGLPVEIALAGARRPLEIHALPTSATTTLSAVLRGSGSVIRTGSIPTASGHGRTPA
ncbi:hypothetical protein [Homoserinibacter sp. GY 40078]|uniref:hypothetical protein n=1 Tax=Homoserinibacter sp. GY 40078 TaxID=2603275 RepID=UPI0011C8003C|nr:hypothetical protein [Homoserinibacter sp. GY 40078]TXK17124.1 hypothetical protein FVQ89_09645 [Homoserinibacter sp. GY 40078]